MPKPGNTYPPSKSLTNRLLNLIKNPKQVILALSNRGFLNLSDEVYTKIQYNALTGKRLDLQTPTTFNEKLLWLKIYGNLENYTHLADKYEVRKYISKTIGEEYLIPLIGVWDRVEDINFDNLPEKFVLKCTHDSGSVVICRDKTAFNIEHAKNELNKYLKRNFYYAAREKQYKNIKPKIICEKYMIDETGIELKDYKIFCFNGIPKIIQVNYDRDIGHKLNFYDTEWNYIPVKLAYHPTESNKNLHKPTQLGNMLDLAKILAKFHPFIRIDFYSINNSVYFGELTFTPNAGCKEFEPQEFNIRMGNWIELPNKYE